MGKAKRPDVPSGSEAESDYEEEEVDERIRRDLLQDEAADIDEVPEDAVDEDEEEELEDDDEDDFVDRTDMESGKRLKRKNPFLDVEASVDQDDEEEEEALDEELDGGFIEAGLHGNEAGDAIELYEKILQKEREKEKMRQKNLAEEVEDLEAEAERLREMFGSRQKQHSRAYTLGDEDARPASSTQEGFGMAYRMPKVTDPRLWLVKVRPGKERDLVFQAMRHLVLQPEPTQGVLSIVMRNHLKGYVYMEAYQESGVRSLLEKLSKNWVMGMRRINLVPTEEMMDVLKVQEKSIKVHVGDWIRIRRGKYKGDLARILEVDPVTEIARIQLVPRISLDPMSKTRPEKKLFNPKSIGEKTNGRGLSKHGSYWFFQGDYFYEGFLEKEIKFSGIDNSDVEPTIEEYEWFKPLLEQGGAAKKWPSQDPLLSAVKTRNWKIGDTVQMAQGEWKNCVGKIEEILPEEMARILVLSRPEQNTGFSAPIKITMSFSTLKPFFKTGDTVKVVKGKHEGKKGMIVVVSDPWVTIYCPDTGEQCQVFLKDIRDSYSIEDKDAIVMSDLKEAPKGALGTSHTTPIVPTALPPVPNYHVRKVSKYHPLMGKTIIVIQGPYKGQMGTVKTVHENSMEIELHSNTKRIRVENSMLQCKDGTPVPSYTSSSAPQYPQTPLHSLYGKTPMPSGTGLGAMTPFMMGGKTPAPLGAMTPFSMTGGNPSFMPGSKTPFMGPGAGYGGAFAAGARTPFASGSKTPYLAGGRTPAMTGGRTPAMYQHTMNQTSFPNPGIYSGQLPMGNTPGSFYGSGSQHTPNAPYGQHGTPGTQYGQIGTPYGITRTPSHLNALGGKTPSGFGSKTPSFVSGNKTPTIPSGNKTPTYP